MSTDRISEADAVPMFAVGDRAVTTAGIEVTILAAAVKGECVRYFVDHPIIPSPWMYDEDELRPVRPTLEELIEVNLCGRLYDTIARIANTIRADDRWNEAEPAESDSGDGSGSGFGYEVITP